MPPTAQIPELVEHLFRLESGKLISVLTGIFGAENLQMAEDVVQDTLMDALNVWNFKGIPDSPKAWLYTVARNKALNILNREKYQKKFTTESSYLLRSESASGPTLEHLFTEKEMVDDQLRMMFTCCHPVISPDSQIALILRTLCGFSVPEIARAFLSTEDSIAKRLVRARLKIRENGISFEMPRGKELQTRSAAVVQAIYLLFNEGYSASSGDDLIRYELCEEAIRLAELLASHPAIRDRSDIYALLALMLFNASRFHARQDESGNILTLSMQDRSKWNKSMIRKGFYYIGKKSPEDAVSVYDILAAISAHHCSTPDFASTDWQSILRLYDSLLQIDHSPLVLLNRAIALAKVNGAASALEELERLKKDEFLESYYLFYATQAELYMELNRVEEAAANLFKAINLAPLQAEKQLLEKKLDALRPQGNDPFVFI